MLFVYLNHLCEVILTLMLSGLLMECFMEIVGKKKNLCKSHCDNFFLSLNSNRVRKEGEGGLMVSSVWPVCKFSTYKVPNCSTLIVIV